MFIELIIPWWFVLGVELIPLGVTFFCCLFVNMEYGILIGAAVHLFLLAYMAGGRPRPELIREPVNAFFSPLTRAAVHNIFSQIFFSG
jgi:sodium-independent sulfate anion transporter 11